MESYLELFISELQEYVKQLNNRLLNLESNPHDAASIAEIFRVFHTIKGMAQTMGFKEMAEVSHGIEDVLGKAKQTGTIQSKLVDFLFIVADLFALINLKYTGEKIPAFDNPLFFKLSFSDSFSLFIYNNKASFLRNIIL